MIGGLTQPTTKMAVQIILDTFSGADGSFVDFMLLLQEMDKKATEGDEAAKKVVATVHGVARFIEIAKKR